MNELFPVAKLGEKILIVNKVDEPHIGDDKGLEVKCINIDLKHRHIDEISELEKHLKFNPWEELTDEERENTLHRIASDFSDEEILEKIIEPLLENVIDKQAL